MNGAKPNSPKFCVTPVKIFVSRHFQKSLFLNRFFEYFHGDPGYLLIFYGFVMKVPLNLSKCSVKCLQEGLFRTFSLTSIPYVTVITL
jgi:hypothetical protein